MSRSRAGSVVGSWLAALLIVSTVNSAFATVYYWDPSSGGTFGSITGTDYWIPSRTIIWTQSTTGNSSRISLLTTALTDDINFASPTSVSGGGMGGGTIPVGFVNAGTISFNSGLTSAVTLSGGVIKLGPIATIFVANTAGDTISASLSGAGTSLTKTGTGTLNLTGSNLNTGTTIVSAGILNLGNSLALGNSALDATTSIAGDATNGLKTTVTKLTFGGLSGSQDLAALFTSTSGGYSGVTALTLNPTAGANLTYSGAIADGAVGMTLTKSGEGNQTLAGANTYTGSTTVIGGTLTLDYNTLDSSKLADGAALLLSGGTVNLNGGTHSEVVGSTTLLGTASITRASGSAVLSLNAISGTGAVDFAADGIAKTTNANDSSGILGAFATVAGANWAKNDGSGNIVAYTTGYTDIGALGGTVASGPTTNVRISSNGSSGNIALAATNTAINTLLQNNSSTAATIDSAGKTLTTKGIMIAAGAESLTIGAAVGAGTLQTAVSGGSLILDNFNSAKTLTINAKITDNTTASALTKGGSGGLTLAGANTYTGPTFIGGGAVSLTGSLTGSSVTVTGSAVLNEAASGSIGGAAALTLSSSGTSTLAGANSYTGATAINAGIVNIQNSTALGTAAAGTSVATGAVLQLQGGITVGTEALTISGTGASDTGVLRNISGNNTWGGLITISAPVRINSDAGTLTLDVPSGNAISGTNLAMIFGGLGNITVADPIAIGSGALQKDGTGTLTLSGANTYTGITMITAGAVNIQNAAALGTTAQGTLIGSGAALQLQGNVSNGEPLTLGSTGVSNDGGIRNISGNNTLSGGVTFIANSRFNSDAGVLTISGAMAANGVAFTSPVMSFGGVGDIVVSGAITPNAASLVKDGTGTLTLSGTANSFGSSSNGTTKINAGTVVIASIKNAGVASSLGQPLAANSAISIGSGATSATLSYIGTGDTTDRVINLAGTTGGAILDQSGTGGLKFNGNITATGAGAKTLTLQGSTSGYGELGGSVADGASPTSLTKTGTGLWLLSGTDSYTGATTVNAGTLGLSGSLTSSNISTSGTGAFGETPTGMISGGVSFTQGSSATSTLTGSNVYTGATSVSAGTLKLSGSLNDSSVSTSGTGVFRQDASSFINGSAVTFTQGSSGTSVLAGANTYGGATNVSAGSLTVTHASGLGVGGGVTVSTGAALNYFAAVDASLAIGGSLTINGGAGTTIGSSIGSTATSAEISVAGDAIITNAAHKVNIYGVNGSAHNVGLTTLIHGAGGGSLLNPSTVPTLGIVYNNTDFTINPTAGDGGTQPFTRTASDLMVTTVGATAMTAAYWQGGLSGAANVWAASNGSTASNWLTSGGAASAVVPGAAADVTISSSNLGSPIAPTVAPTATVLGASMTIKTLTIADTASGLGLNADGSTLTITPASSSTGITMNANVPASLIAADLVLGADQTWTNNSANTLTVSGAVSGAAALTKAGSGKITVSGVNSYSGGTTINSGTMQFANVASMPPSGTVAVGDGTTLVVNLGGAGEWNTGTSGNGSIGGLLSGLGGQSGGGVSWSGNVVLGLDTTNGGTQIYAGNIGDVGSSLSINKLGAGTLTLSVASTYIGVTTISAGTIKVGNAAALGAGTSAADGTTVTPGATLDLGGVSNAQNSSVGTERVTASGTGVGGNGAIISSTAIATPFIGIRYLTLAGNTTLGYANRWDVGSSTAANNGFVGGGFNLTFLGTAAAAQASLNFLGETDLGDITVNLGSVTATNILFLQGSTTLGRPANTISIIGGSALDVFTNSTVTTLDKKFALDNGNIKIDKTGTMSLPGTISLNNSNTITANASTVLITASNVISGTGILNKAGAGSLTLTGTNIYTGATNIQAGTLALGATGSIATSSLINISPTATFDVSAVSGFALTQTLAAKGAGTANVLGALDAAAQKLDLQDGVSIGTLALSSGLTMNGATLTFDLSATTGDLIAVTGAATLAGTNTINVGALTTASSLAVGSHAYTLLTAGSGLVSSNFALSSSSATVNSTTYSFSLSGDATHEYLDVSIGAAAVAGTWNVNASGAWNTTGNWSGGVPGLGGTSAGNDTATFAAAATSVNPVVTLDGVSPVLKGITFNNAAHGYTIAQGTGGTLTLNGGASPSTVDVTSGSHTISAPLSLATNTNITLANAGSLTLSGAQAWAGHNVAVSGAGTITISGTQSNASPATFTVNSGVVANINTDGGTGLSLVNGGVTNLKSSQTLAGVTINSGAHTNVTTNTAQPVATGPSVLVTPTLSIASHVVGSDTIWDGYLDLANNKLVVQTGGLSGTALQAAVKQVASQVRSGYNLANGSGTLWMGTGIGSSSAAADTRRIVGLAVFQNNTKSFGSVDGTVSDGTGNAFITTPFGGATVAKNDTLVKFTYFGDTDLDGVITAGDYANIDLAFAHQQTLGPQSGWANGDFDYDGSITAADYSLMDSAFAAQSGALAEGVHTLSGSLGSVTAVPEPSTWLLGIMGIIGLLTMARRRRVKMSS